MVGIFKRKSEDFDKHLSDFPLSAFIEDEWRMEDGDDGDTTSHSTMSTVTDNPGPGRVLDKYILQPLGSKLEKILESLRTRGRVAHSVGALRTSKHYLPTIPHTE